MKRNWSVFRITVLLYVIVILLPLNYYFASSSFESMRHDGTTMQRLVYVNGAIQRVSGFQKSKENRELVQKIEETFKSIDHDFLQDRANAEYVKLFRADEAYGSMIEAWIALKMTLETSADVQGSAERCWNEVNSFSETAENMLSYKSEVMLDKLYLSLIFTMLSVLVLVFLIRLFIHIQIQKHAIHDHVTGLYNQKYYAEVLQKSKLLASRQESPLSLLSLSFDDYEGLKKRLGKKHFEQFLQEFSKQFREFFRQSDTVCRIADNSFVVITPEVDQGNSEKLVNRLEKRLCIHHYETHEVIRLHVGMASYHKESGMALLEEANEVKGRRETVVLGGDL